MFMECLLSISLGCFVGQYFTHAPSHLMLLKCVMISRKGLSNDLLKGIELWKAERRLLSSQLPVRIEHAVEAGWEQLVEAGWANVNLPGALSSDGFHLD